VYPDDPTKGPKDALVTIVAFSEFESPFCKRAAATLDELLVAYPDDLRVVWKDNPLPFNKRARPTASFARYVYADKGERAFWRTHDALFASQPKLLDDDLRAIAATVGVPWGEAKAAIDANKFGDKIDQSIELGGDVDARGTPHFFVNGRRLAGSRPLDAFKALVDEMLVKARDLVARGTPREGVYDAIIREGREAPPLVKKAVPRPDASSPSRGSAAAPVVIQQFATFPCGACARSARVLADLEAEYQGRIRIVWRFLLAGSDAGALLAAQAGIETFAQRGSASFATFHERVLEAQQRSELDEKILLRIATETAVDTAKLKQAWSTGRHKSRVVADSDLGTQMGLDKSPSFTVGDYLIPGDARGPVFKKAINRALREAKGE
jgi:protein-disulfide isomerase